MDLDNKDIQLIEQYLLGQLSGEELQAFEQRMKDEPALADEVAIYRNVIKGVERHGRENRKAGLAAMMAGLEAKSAELDDYQPSQPPKPKGGSAGSGVKWLGSIILLGGAVFLYLWQTGQIHHLQDLWDELPTESLQQLKPAPPPKVEPKVVYEIKRDTIVQEKREIIYTQQQVVKKDTVWNMELQPKGQSYETEFSEEPLIVPETTFIRKEIYDTLAVPN